jgi:predicted dehydrogenase
LEWQLRNWNYFTWSGGDHIVEQHVHNLDIMQWVLGHPVRAYGMGGRQARIERLQGNIYDHFAIEFEYANGLRMQSQCRQMENCRDRVEEQVIGTKGGSNCCTRIWAKDGPSWSFQGKDVNQYRQEHLDLINSIRAGKPLNEARAVAESTLMGIMGREAAYSGQVVEWDSLLASGRHLGPEKYEFGPTPFPEVPVPGKHTAG